MVTYHGVATYKFVIRAKDDDELWDKLSEADFDLDDVKITFYINDHYRPDDGVDAWHDERKLKDVI